MEGDPGKPKVPRRKYRIKLKLPQLAHLTRLRSKPKRSPEQSDSLPETPLTFGEQLDQNSLAEASRALISREDQLFLRGSEEPDPGSLQQAPGSHGGSDGGGGGGGEEGEKDGEDDEDVLQKDLEALMCQVWMVVHNIFPSPSSNSSSTSSFSSTSSSSTSSSSSSTSFQDDLRLLQSAVSVIQQQEAQDRRWEELQKKEEERGGGSAVGGGGGGGGGGEGGGDEGGVNLPVWRPVECLKTHGELLAAMVESRLNSAAPVDSGGGGGGGGGGATTLSSEAKKELCGLGKRLQEDLLVVASKVPPCYPAEWGVPELLAGLYHRGFGRRLSALGRTPLGVEDCSYLLFWVNDYYPKAILKHKELQSVFASAELGALVPQEELNQLEDQYLAHKEGQVGAWLGSALASEQKSWQRGPEKMDLYWFSPLAVDTLQIVENVVCEARLVLSDPGKAQRITAQLQTFLTSYRKALEDFTRRNHDNGPAVVKANLGCIQQFRSFLEKDVSVVSAEQVAGLQGSVRALEDWGYGVLTGPIHLEIKPQYRLLWSGSWLARARAGCVLDGLLEALDRQLQPHTDLKPACLKVLLGRLHEEVLVEYVKRLMKGKVMMRTSEEQEEAASLLCDHGDKIHGYFSEEGSPRAELHPLLSRIAELLRLQERDSLQLEVATMAMQYPDLRSSHVAALLSLKYNLLAADARVIKKSIHDTPPQQPSTNHIPFFSRVPVKWINRI